MRASTTKISRGVRVGCDIGGTFTDVVLAMPDGRLFVNKTSTTPENLGKAIVQGLGALLQQAGVAPEEITDIVHGTTTASNTVLQKVGAKSGVLTTAGFRDVLEIGRIPTPTMFDLSWSKPAPLAIRRWRRGIQERISATGDRLKFRPYRLQGGLPASAAINALEHAGETHRMPSKVGMTFQRRDVVSHTQPGGGGFGNPLERPLSAIEHDVWNHKMTADFVREHYQVGVDPESGKLDEIATAKLRAMAN